MINTPILKEYSNADTDILSLDIFESLTFCKTKKILNINEHLVILIN